jgi:predicted deacylase
MKEVKDELTIRRLSILKGISEGLTNSKIAAKLGVPRSILNRDLRRMKRERGRELNQAYLKAKERVQAKKISDANLPYQRFHSITGMTIKEKSFKNMMLFYGPELKKILEADNEGLAINDLSLGIRRTLKRNGILKKGWKTSELTKLAREHLTRKI